MTHFIRKATIESLRPRIPRVTWDWVCEKIRAPNGKPFNPYDYPWTKGICDAWDDPRVRQITMQFAARLGKTMTAIALMTSAIEYDPGMGMICLPTEPLLRDMIRDKYYPVLDRCSATKQLTPAKHFRTQTRIDLMTSIIYGAWSGSPTTLADKEPRYKHGGEVDKMDKSISLEADPLDLFLERGIEIVDRKTIVESTPSIRNKSRVESHLINGWNARYLIPCPLCRDHIELLPGEDGRPGKGGIVFDRGEKSDTFPDGAFDRKIAYATARYQCQSCFGFWSDMQRKPAIQKGVWVPAGMSVDKKGELSGEMIGSYENASFQLSRLYAPTFTFSDIAQQIAWCHLDSDRWHNTCNSWFGQTYVQRKATKEWYEVGRRLARHPYEIRTVPVGGIFLTIGVDVQRDFFVYTVIAWGWGAQGWVVDYGIAHSEADLEKVWKSKYRHADGGPDIGISLGLIDSGEGIRQDEVFDLAKRLNKELGPWFWPSKGSSGSIAGGKTFKQQTLDELTSRNRRSKREKKKRTLSKLGLRGFYHITVNTPFFQSWIQSALHYRLPGEMKSLSIPQEAEEDEDFLKQLVNERPEDSTSSTGHSSTKWVVVDESIPVDLRDSVRYSRCGAEMFVRGAWGRVSKQRLIGKVATKETATDKMVAPAKKNVSAKKAAPAVPAQTQKSFVRPMSTRIRRMGGDRFVN